jgi:hypothetical protein
MPGQPDHFFGGFAVQHPYARSQRPRAYRVAWISKYECASIVAFFIACKARALKQTIIAFTNHHFVVIIFKILK